MPRRLGTRGDFHSRKPKGAARRRGGATHASEERRPLEALRPEESGMTVGSFRDRKRFFGARARNGLAGLLVALVLSGCALKREPLPDYHGGNNRK